MAELLEVGRIAKAHGLKGEVIVELFTNREERVAPGAVLTAPKGNMTVKRSQPHQHRFIVHFEGVNSREEAEALHGTLLSAEPLDDEDALWVHELVGADVLKADGVKVGIIEHVLANPAGDIVETDTGILIPLRFVVEHGVDQAGVNFIRVDPPAGLLEVNEK